MSPILKGVVASGITGRLNTFAPIGAYDALATVTVPSGGLSSITFAGIPQTGYAHLQLRIMAQTNRASSTGDDINMTFNNSSSDYYGYHILYGTGTGSAAATDNSLSSAIDLTRFSCVNAGANVFSAGIIDVLDYTSTSKHKTVKQLAGVDSNGTGTISFGSGLWKPTTPVAINSITLVPFVGTGFSQYSSFALYGVK
jgi:hypothetical protein